ncbi:hypothetical protein MHYP_G00290520 [Metynnis hypsauchen]
MNLLAFQLFGIEVLEVVQSSLMRAVAPLSMDTWASLIQHTPLDHRPAISVIVGNLSAAPWQLCGPLGSS